MDAPGDDEVLIEAPAPVPGLLFVRVPEVKAVKNRVHFDWEPSKAQWGYDARFLEACRPGLTLRPHEISARRVVVAEASGHIVGFYTLDGVPPEGELGDLWIEPTHMRRGVGRRLWDHAMAAARAIGFTAVLIDAEPHAEGFYAAMGAERIGAVPSTAIAGRLLPQMRLRLSS